MNKFAAQRRCVVCGAILPNQSKESLIAKGCGLVRPDGGVIWHCPHHTEDQVIEALNHVPTFARRTGEI